MKRPDKRPCEGILRENAGTADKEGFIAPSIGAVEHALYFTAASSVIEKAKQILDEGRLRLPGVVVAWDETAAVEKAARPSRKAGGLRMVHSR
jgi:hypothetical protein